jgi:carbonic anhydrase/acetyltransferase-like protein (isoleucine patch superfamily)
LLASHGSDGEVLFGHVDRTLTLPPIEPGRPDGGSIRLIESAQDGSWTGWAVLKGRILDQFPGHAFDRRDVEQFLYAGHAGSLERTAMPAGPEIRCMESYMSAVREVLAAACPGAEIRIPRSARVHPTARLTGPVFLGPGVEIGAEATVGPNVAVGPNSIVDRHTKLTNAVVMPDTFIGGRMWLDSAVVDRDRVVSPGPGGFVHVDREVPVASLADHPFTHLAPTALANRAKSVVRNLGGVPTRFFRKVLGTSGIRRSDQPIIEPVPAAAN